MVPVVSKSQAVKEPLATAVAPVRTARRRRGKGRNRRVLPAPERSRQSGGNLPFSKACPRQNREIKRRPSEPLAPLVEDTPPNNG